MSTLKFSKVISGCMSWGKWGKKFSKKEMQNLMEFCVDQDITTFDHADIYGDYSTEAEFGEAFNLSTVSRDRIQLISKCGIQYTGEARANKVKHYNYSKEYIIWSAEQSLKHLKTDYLNAFLLHRPSPLMRPEEIMEAITKLKQDGKILGFGVSNFTSSQMALIHTEIPISINQIEFSLTQCNAMHDGTLDYILHHGIQPMAWSPLGTIFREDNNQSQRIRELLNDFTVKYSATEDQLLLAWIMKHPSGVLPVVGTTDKQRLLNAKNAADIELDLEDWFLMLVASQGHKVP